MRWLIDVKNIYTAKFKRWVGMLVQSSLGRQRRVDCYELEPGWSTHRVSGQPELPSDPVSKNKTKRKFKRCESTEFAPHPWPLPGGSLCVRAGAVCVSQDIGLSFQRNAASVVYMVCLSATVISCACSEVSAWNWGVWLFSRRCPHGADCPASD